MLIPWLGSHSWLHCWPHAQPRGLFQAPNRNPKAHLLPSPKLLPPAPPHAHGDLAGVCFLLFFCCCWVLGGGGWGGRGGAIVKLSPSCFSSIRSLTHRTCPPLATETTSTGTGRNRACCMEQGYLLPPLGLQVPQAQLPQTKDMTGREQDLRHMSERWTSSWHYTSTTGSGPTPARTLQDLQEEREGNLMETDGEAE